MAKHHELNLTRAALYALEACLQDPGPCTAPNKTVLWAKVWDKVRKANNRLVTVPWAEEGVDLEKPPLRLEGETDIAWETRRRVWNDAFEVWQDTPITLTLSDKYRDACREAMKFVTTQKDKARVKLENSLHAATLLIELGLAEDSEEEAADGDAPAADQSAA